MNEKYSLPPDVISSMVDVLVMCGKTLVYYEQPALCSRNEDYGQHVVDTRAQIEKIRAALIQACS